MSGTFSIRFLSFTFAAFGLAQFASADDLPVRVETAAIAPTIQDWDHPTCPIIDCDECFAGEETCRVIDCDGKVSASYEKSCH